MVGYLESIVREIIDASTHKGVGGLWEALRRLVSSEPFFLERQRGVGSVISPGGGGRSGSRRDGSAADF